MVQSEIYSPLSVLSLNFFVVRLHLVGIFERLAKTLKFFRSRYLNLFTPSQVTNVNTYLHLLGTKNKNIFYSVKDRLRTKIQIQFSKIQDKKPFVGPFLLPKNSNLILLK